ncbi:MAG TPA: DUF6279 family lipoprotein [Oligoflexus sp.]|uniref:DUF6279 family lipoprotein n=1 Tax=Oligoflexus sp. TaxID=1971216 RepID=UPI002D7F7AA8|nr:DUF6279 family lipoprotein [Oligoflexus sp.]HET9237957.1 DUF6279 family lipoprotein [Oligoflexus sp.]
MNFWRFPRKTVAGVVVRCLGFILPILIFSGCAYKRMIFNNLDWLVVYQMDSYLDLTGAQEKSIKIPVHETIDWLKAERLPAITDLLRDVQKAVAARRIDVKTFEGWVKRVEVWRTEVTERFTPPMALLLKQLDAEQIEHLEEKLGKNDRKLAKLLERSDSDFPEEFEDFVDDAAASYKFWIGKMRKDQKAMMVEKLGWNRATLTETLKQKRRSREFWIELLKKHDRDLIVTALRRSAEPEGSFRDPEHLRFRKDSRERMQSFLIALFASLDQDQWQHLEKVMRELVVDMESLNVPQRSRT